MRQLKVSVSEQGASIGVCLISKDLTTRFLYHRTLLINMMLYNSTGADFYGEQAVAGSLL